jgi:Uma2 family endonuclease
LPYYLHGKTQLLLAAFFAAFAKAAFHFSLHRNPNEDPQPTVRDPDLAVFWPEEAVGVPETPPLAAIEILSPDDRLAEVPDKLEEYKTWGVAHVWLVDPYSRRMYVCEAGLLEMQSLKISELRGISWRGYFRIRAGRKAGPRKSVFECTVPSSS